MAKVNLKKWHEIVCSRAGWHCEHCGRWGDKQTLCGHHFPHSRGSRIDLALDVNNGVALCSDCHTKIHMGLIKLK